MDEGGDVVMTTSTTMVLISIFFFYFVVYRYFSLQMIMMMVTMMMMIMMVTHGSLIGTTTDLPEDLESDTPSLPGSRETSLGRTPCSRMQAPGIGIELWKNLLRYTTVMFSSREEMRLNMLHFVLTFFKEYIFYPL